jgi:hypothetical protein
LIIFEQWIYQSVSWQGTHLALPSTVEGPEEGIPRIVDNPGGAFIGGGGHTSPTTPRTYGTGVPVLGDTPRDRTKDVYKPRREDQQ